jgi:hypothetical protein
MSRRQSRSAIFIGGFHNVDRNRTDIAEHVARWRSHVERWIRQLEGLLRERRSVSRLRTTQRTAGPRASQPQDLSGPDQARNHLEERSSQLARKIEEVLYRIEDVGFLGVAESLEARYKPLRSALFPGIPQRSKGAYSTSKELASIAPSLRRPPTRPSRRRK